MFRAIWKVIRSIGYLLTGRVDRLREGIDKDPVVVKARFENIVRKQKESLNQYVDAITMLVTQEEKKKARLEQLKAQRQQLQTRMSGAVAMMQQKLKELRASGKSDEQIRQDPDYQKCMLGHKDLSATLQTVESEIPGIEADITSYGKQIDGHKLRLMQLQREIEATKRKAADTVADIISSSEERRMNEVLAGISTGGIGEELEELEDMRQKAKAAAKVSRELAGADVQLQMAEFDKYATEATAQSEFDKLIGLSVPAAPEAQQEAQKAPEGKLPD